MLPGDRKEGTAAICPQMRPEGIRTPDYPCRIDGVKFTSEKLPLMKCQGSRVLPWGLETSNHGWGEGVPIRSASSQEATG